MRYKIGYTERVFIFVFVVLAFLVALILSGRERIPFFTKEKKLKIISTRSYGLKSGSLVKMKDLEIGIVESVSLNEKNQIEMILSIKKKYSDRIRKDSTAMIQLPPIIGSAEVVITCGTKKYPELKSGDIITLKEPESDLITDISSLPKKIEPAIDNLNAILKNFKIVSDNIAQGRGSLGRFLHDEQIYDQALTMIIELNKFATGIQPVIDNLAKASDKFPEIAKDVDKILSDFQKMQKDIEITVKNVKDTTGSVSNITKRIEKGEGTIGKILTDEAIHQEAKNVLSSTSSILHKIDSVNIAPSLDTSFHSEQDVVVSKIKASISTGKAQRVEIGGAFIGHKKEKTHTKPEILFSQEIPARGIILSGGIMEGQVGGGVDFKLKDKIWTVEGRKTSSSDIYDTNLKSFLLRLYLGKNVNDDIRLKIGISDILGKPSFSGGIIVGLDRE